MGGLDSLTGGVGACFPSPKKQSIPIAYWLNNLEQNGTAEIWNNQRTSAKYGVIDVCPPHSTFTCLACKTNVSEQQLNSML